VVVVLVTDIVERRNDADPLEVVEPVAAQTLYKVIKTIDGDIIDVLTEDKKTIRLRFNGIDAPERGQPFGNRATPCSCRKDLAPADTHEAVRASRDGQKAIAESAAGTSTLSVTTEGDDSRIVDFTCCRVTAPGGT